MQLFRFPYSTNVDRVLLALAHKGLEVESVWVDPADRRPVEAASGQSLVPVLVAGEEVVPDSTAIIEWLDAHSPSPPLFPADPAAAAHVRLFIDWFNRVWKHEPNALADALDAGRSPSEPELTAHSAAIRARLDRFDALLSDGRPYLFGDFGAADCSAWPFLRYGLWIDADDTETFHRVIHEHQVTVDHPHLTAWLERVRDGRWHPA